MDERKTEQILTGGDLVVKARVFKDRDGNLIELVGITDHGRCGRWHQRGEICRDCMLNCEHYLKINDEFLRISLIGIATSMILFILLLILNPFKW